jgi:xanthine dehydrogenase accessory factor
MRFRYLGLLGSEKKISQMMATYRGEGFPPGWLASVYAPVGLSISSQTPEEIAVSIAAQIIRVKNKISSGNEQD